MSFYTSRSWLRLMIVYTFCPSSTSVPVERALSRSGLFVRPHPTRIGDNLPHQLMLAKCNTQGSGVARGGVGGFKPPVEKCPKISEDKIVKKYTKLKFARVKASSNDIISINRFANFGL